MTNAQSKSMEPIQGNDNHTNRLISLTNLLYRVLPNRDIVHTVLENVNEIETREERTYFKTIHSLRDRKNDPYNASYLPYNLQASIHLFREGYIGTLSSTSLELPDKIEIVNLVSSNRGWNSRHHRKGTSFTKHYKELQSIKQSIEWVDKYKQTNPEYTKGGLIIVTYEGKEAISVRFAYKDRQGEILHSLTQSSCKIPDKHYNMYVTPGRRPWPCWRRNYTRIFQKRTDFYVKQIKLEDNFVRWV